MKASGLPNTGRPELQRDRRHQPKSGKASVASFTRFVKFATEITKTNSMTCSSEKYLRMVARSASRTVVAARVTWSAK